MSNKNFNRKLTRNMRSGQPALAVPEGGAYK